MERRAKACKWGEYAPGDTWPSDLFTNHRPVKKAAKILRRKVLSAYTSVYHHFLNLKSGGVQTGFELS